MVKLRGSIAAFALLALVTFCEAATLSTGDPLDGALFSNLIVIVRQVSPGVLEIQEAFLGDVAKGQLLQVPGFALMVDDMAEAISRDTRILIFLKHAGKNPETWRVVDPGNCYFWSHDPKSLEELREKAKSALALRNAWWAANTLDEPRARVTALWPFLWGHNPTVLKATKMAIWSIDDDVAGFPIGEGPNTVGDFVAEQLPSLTPEKFRVLFPEVASWQTGKLQVDLIAKMKDQQRRWEKMVARYGADAVMEQADLFDPDHPPAASTRSELATEVRDVCEWLSAGIMGLISFPDRTNTAFVSELALWGARNRVRPVMAAALGAFREQPLAEDLPALRAIEDVFTKDSDAFDVLVTLKEHRFPETIPLIARFANEKYPQAHAFLRQLTGVDLGNDPKAWIAWYDANKRRLGVED